MPEISSSEIMYAIKNSFSMSTYDTSEHNNELFSAISNNDIDYILDGSNSLCLEC